jgi:hypothetical protein
VSSRSDTLNDAETNVESIYQRPHIG